MKYSEILSTLDLSKKSVYYIKEDFLREFDLWEADVDIDKIKLSCIRITAWYCTDSLVGVSVILLDDEPVSFSLQVARKANEEFYWVSNQAYLKTKQVVENARIIREPQINLINLDDNFGDYYQLSFTGELISGFHDVGFFNEKRVVVEGIKSNDYIEKRVKVTFEDGTSEIVQVQNVKFPILGIK